MTDNKNDDTGKKGTEEATGQDKTARKSAYVLPGDEAAAESEVIQLDEKRTAEGAGLLEGVIGDALRQSLRNFVVDKVVPKGQKEGQVNLNLDVDFLRDHGRELISALVQGVAKAVLPEKIAVNLPIGAEKTAPEKKETGEEGGAEAEKADVDVSVNFDFMNFFRGLIASPIAAAAEAASEGALKVAEAAEAAVEDEEAEDAVEPEDEKEGDE